MHPTEEAIIQAFIEPHRRWRWRQSLASPKLRSRILGNLNNGIDLDSRYCQQLHRSTSAAELLRSHGAPSMCYVLSYVDELDGREMTLEDAEAAIREADWGTIISCIPGRLGYHFAEHPYLPSLLIRKA